MSLLLHSSSTASSSLRATHSNGTKAKSVLQQRVVVARAFDTDKLLKKPELPRADPPKKLFEGQAEAPSNGAAAPSIPSTSAAPTTSSGVTIEYQRARAKEMLKYFQQRKLELEAKKNQLFGFTRPNEIFNGRWVMFGVAVGLLTEYATGVDFPRQLGLMLSYLGIVDLD